MKGEDVAKHKQLDQEWFDSVVRLSEATEVRLRVFLELLEDLARGCEHAVFVC